MPRYYLDLHDEQSTTRDTVGIECADGDAVGVMANRLLAEVAAHEPIIAGQKTLLASVRDEAGHVVYASTLNLTGTRVQIPAKVPPTQVILQVA
ncbi:DUF6894 family protein [Methylobacterium durans]|uniref:DUF6894 domain-containing protein n=1 Tax=Methylobacterium durans TaxID=2202825 RepID=A0A2U8W0I6_9HYPH|nr:hypothetical protein [Methylobacterium durans]AWN39557.1 hypothetical protein DK389_02205 [Methylobacterium durans]